MAADYMYPFMNGTDDMNPASPMMGCPLMQSMASPAAMSPVMGCPLMQSMVPLSAMASPAMMAPPGGMYPLMWCPLMYNTVNPMMSPMMQGMGIWDYPENPMMRTYNEGQE